MNKGVDMYKKVMLNILLGICFMMCVSCTTPVTAEGTKETPQSFPKEPLSIEEPQPVSLVQITAKVEINGVGNIILVENWESKSRKSYEVVGDMATILQDFIGKLIVADVIFLEKKMWSGSLVVVEYEPYTAIHSTSK